MGQPSQTILERIARNRLDALKGVRVHAGYTIDLIAERPDAVDGNPVRDGLAVLTMGQPTRQGEGVPVTLTGWDQPFEVACTRIRSQADESGMDVLLARLCGDVMRAVTADESCGGLAFDTWLDDPTFDYLGANANAGVVTVRFTVRYRTLFNDPFRSPHETYE